ncbi:hypothetical protein CDAR_580621 [Caerostris darwini]|uniref:Uncharacterized protein n=1 Tax=Caerostris darwini TaxID=1538125 RepID=A0AAV4R1N6_9ARAC|nr:hypothetical protein CDAR_580621 [Caerostris darwini]
MQAFQAAISVIRIDSYIVKGQNDRYPRIYRLDYETFHSQEKANPQKDLADVNLRRLLNLDRGRRLKTLTFQTSAKTPAKNKRSAPKDTL